MLYIGGTVKITVKYVEISFMRMDIISAYVPCLRRGDIRTVTQNKLQRPKHKQVPVNYIYHARQQ